MEHLLYWTGFISGANAAMALVMYMTIRVDREKNK